MSRNRTLNKNNGRLPVRTFPKKRNFFIRHHAGIGSVAGALSVSLAYKSCADSKIQKKQGDLNAKKEKLDVMMDGFYQEMKGPLNKASKENRELAIKLRDDAVRNVNESVWKKHDLSMLNEFEDGLKRHDAKSLMNEASFDELMVKIQRVDTAIIPRLKELRKAAVEKNREKKEIATKTGGVAIGSFLGFILAFFMLKKVVLIQRARKMAKQKGLKKKKAREEREAKEEKSRRKEEKRKRKEEEKKRVREREVKQLRKAGPVFVKEKMPKKRKRLTKKELKAKVAGVLRPELGEDAVNASKLMLKYAGREGCKKIIDHPDDAYEIIGKHCGGKEGESELEWIMDKVSEKEEDGSPKEYEDNSYGRYQASELGIPEDVKKELKEKGLDVESVKIVIVYGFGLHTPKRAIGRVYKKTDLINKKIDQELSYEYSDPGKEREEILDFLKSHGVVSLYKRGRKCMMINTVTSLGQAMPVTETGEKILKATVEWILEFRKRHQA
jgi:hypothetical protein